MTIAAAYLVSEGVVLGADSSTMISTPSGPGGRAVLQLISHSQKVFEVGENSRFGVCTWGAGSLGKTSHRTAIAQLAEKIAKDTTVQSAAEVLGEVVKPLVKSSGIDFVGYYLGGWQPESHDPACVKIEVSQKAVKIEPIPLGMCSFSGMPYFFTRVFRGYDLQLPEKLRDEIKSLLPDGDIPRNFDEIFRKAFDKASAPLIAAGFKDLPIREAIDFVYSYLHITLKATKFRFGAPAVGGPIEIGFLTTDRPFRWACHKTFSSAIFEQEEVYG
jgi:hypothetical protein